MQKKIESVKQYIGAMKIEETPEGFYIRFRKSKNNKTKADQYHEILELEDENFKRIGEYEFIISEKEFERIYKMYHDKLYAREF